MEKPKLQDFGLEETILDDYERRRKALEALDGYVILLGMVIGLLAGLYTSYFMVWTSDEWSIPVMIPLTIYWTFVIWAFSWIPLAIAYWVLYVIVSLVLEMGWRLFANDRRRNRILMEQNIWSYRKALQKFESERSKAQLDEVEALFRKVKWKKSVSSYEMQGICGRIAEIKIEAQADGFLRNAVRIEKIEEELKKISIANDDARSTQNEVAPGKLSNRTKIVNPSSENVAKQQRTDSPNITHENVKGSKGEGIDGQISTATSDLEEIVTNEKKGSGGSPKAAAALLDDGHLSDVGYLGELFCLKLEAERLRARKITDLSFPIHVAQTIGDHFGCDIASLSEALKFKYIEVKTTTGPFETKFFMTSNEMRFMKNNPERYEIHRVFAFNPETGTGQVRIISGLELIEEMYVIEPSSFIMISQQ